MTGQQLWLGLKSDGGARAGPWCRAATEGGTVAALGDNLSWGAHVAQQHGQFTASGTDRSDPGVAMNARFRITNHANRH